MGRDEAGLSSADGCAVLGWADGWRRRRSGWSGGSGRRGCTWLREGWRGGGGRAGMLMPGHIDSHVRWARRAICLLLIFVPSWRSMPSLIRAETRWPAPVRAVLTARRSLCSRKLYTREVNRPGMPRGVVAWWAGISQARAGICMRDLRARLASRSRP